MRDSADKTPEASPAGDGQETAIDDLARGWVLPTAEEIDECWKSADIVLDTNVLLNLYRYSAKGRTELLSLLDQIAGRLWFPSVVVAEFFRGRMAARVREQTAEDKLIKAVNEAEKNLVDAVDKVNHELGRRREPPAHAEMIREALKEVRDKVLAAERERTDQLGTHDDDVVLRPALALFEGRVGPAPSTGDMKRLTDEGKRRYEAKIPPGFGDTKKGDQTRFGDWFAWRQILDHASGTHRPVILVTDDSTKGDWFWELSGRTLGALPELTREMYDEAKVAFLLYTSERFIREARSRLLSEPETVSDSTVDEARDLGEGAERERAEALNAFNLAQDLRSQGLVGRMALQPLMADLHDVVAAAGIGDASIRHVMLEPGEDRVIVATSAAVPPWLESVIRDLASRTGHRVDFLSQLPG